MAVYNQLSKRLIKAIVGHKIYSSTFSMLTTDLILIYRTRQLFIYRNILVTLILLI